MQASAFTRRRFLGVCAWSVLGAPAILRAAPLLDKTDSAADAALGEIWRRFVTSRHDTMLHYSGLDGELILPTPEDCAAARPNGMSWSTPIEDGPFFGGLLLAGLCRRWERLRSDQAAADARRIAGGLTGLADVGATPGFIPRGFASDGRAYYPASSEDQMLPWFYGLWRYVRSGIPSSQEKATIRARLVGTALALESHGWQIPCDPLSFGYRGSYMRPRHTDCARLLFLHRALFDLTGDERWLERYRLLADEPLGPQRKTRRQWCAVGMDYGPPTKADTYLWTSSMSQAALRALWEMETNRDWREDFSRGLTASAVAALPHLERYRRFDSNNRLRFDVDWRFLNVSWKPQRNCDEAISLARQQLPLWALHNPRSPWEDDTMREPLFAAWIVALAPDPGLRAETSSSLAALLGHYPWRRLYTSLFFIAVCLQAELAAHS